MLNRMLVAVAVVAAAGTADARHWRRDDATVHAVTDVDYFVIAVERRETLAQPGLLTALPFNQLWKEVAPLLAQRNAPAAEDAFQMLESAVLVSPDLSEADRVAVLSAFQKSYTDLSDLLAKPNSPARNRGDYAHNFVARIVR